MGFKNWACRLVSNKSGDKPAKVVSEVKKIALKREIPALIRASSNFKPSLRKPLNFLTKTNPSFTIIPTKAIIPNQERIFIGSP